MKFPARIAGINFNSSWDLISVLVVLTIILLIVIKLLQSFRQNYNVYELKGQRQQFLKSALLLFVIASIPSTQYHFYNKREYADIIPLAYCIYICCAFLLLLTFLFREPDQGLFSRIGRLFQPRPYVHPGTAIVYREERNALREFGRIMQRQDFQDRRAAELFQRLSFDDQATWRERYEERTRQAHSLADTVEAQRKAQEAEIRLAQELIYKEATIRARKQ